MSLLQVEGLGKAFGGNRAVEGICFSVAAGELLALIGPNGAGKSTTFNLVGGQLRADSGSIRLAGTELIGRTPRAIWRLGVGRTFQIAATFASLTVIENVQTALLSADAKLYSFWHRATDHRRGDALALLEQVGMRAQADRPCSVLAYGDVKRVELAIAIAHAPRLLLMDEPTAGMAPQERHELMALTRRLVALRGMAVLFTEHSMDVVFAHADRVVVLARGRLIAQGTSAAVREDPTVQEVYLGTGATFERMTAPGPPGTSVHPPGGSGLAWGGPAREMTAFGPPGTPVHPPGGSGLAWGGPAREMTAPGPPGTSVHPPGGSGLAWGGPARRPGDGFGAAVGAPTPPLLEANALNAWYGAAQILFDVTLQVNRGEVVALMGRNGAGKSTTLKALMGLLARREGRIGFLGQDVSTAAPHAVARAGLGYVPEDRRVFADLSVAENLEVGRQPPRRWADGTPAPAWTPEALFALFPNLGEMLDRPAGHMSGGEQQMLSVARTLMGNPFVVLLDEPSEGIAPVIVEQMARMILALKAQGVSILLSEQNLHFAELVCDRAYVLERGQIRYEGPMAELSANDEVRRAHFGL